MDPSGDIHDAFDDDLLRESIEKADRAGQWRDAAANFVDPKLEQLKKQLTEPERADYAERRRRDLQRRALGEPIPTAPPQKAPVATQVVAPDPFAADGPYRPGALVPPPPIDTGPVDWRETVVKNPARPPAAEPEQDVFDHLQRRIAANAAVRHNETAQPLLGYSRQLASGFAVFVPITFVLVLVAGARIDLVVRGIVASLLGGIGWNEFQAGRRTATAIGCGVYSLAFLTTPNPFTGRDLVANLVGLSLTAFGSAFVGHLRERRTTRSL